MSEVGPPSGARPAGRQTQRERSAATVGKLLDATIDALYQLGYARTSIQEICRRAGVSHGGLFRHFDTRLDLMVAAAEEVSSRLAEQFRTGMAKVGAEQDVLTAALAELRVQMRSRLNVVWHEVLVAARTDENLRVRLQPAADRAHATIRAVALELPGIEAFPQDMLEPALFAVLDLFNGEARVRHVRNRTDLDDRTLHLARCVLAAAQRGMPGQPGQD